jgi:chromosome segregation ATPase
MAYKAVRGCEEEYTLGIDEFGSLVSELKELLTGPLKARAEMKLKEVDDKIVVLKSARKSYNFELKLIKDRDERKSYDEVAQALDQRRDDLIGEVETLRRKVAQNQSRGDADKTFLDNGKINNETAGRSNDQLLSGAATIQELTKQSVARSRALMDNSKEIGGETNQQLVEQRQRLASIHKEAEGINAKLERSRQLIDEFARRIAGDRMIQIFCTINIIILLIFIFYVLATGKRVETLFEADTMAPTQAPTPNPTAARRFLR